MPDRKDHWFSGLVRAIIARVLLFGMVVALVWISFVWLYAMHPDTLGWIYATLRPITISLFGIIDNRLPEAIKYKVSAGLSDELGPRALFLLMLGGVIELALITVWQTLRRVTGGRSSH